MAGFVVSENEQKLIDNISLYDYYNENIVPKRQGFRKISPERSSGICPFHSDTDPSFHVWRENKIYKCFGCDSKGNIIQLHTNWMRVEYNRYIDKKTAMLELAQMYNVELEFESSGKLKEETPFEKARKRLNRDKFEVNAFDMNNMTLAGFRTFNNQIKGQIEKMPYASDEQVAKLYYKLDLTLSAY